MLNKSTLYRSMLEVFIRTKGPYATRLGTICQIGKTIVTINLTCGQRTIQKASNDEKLINV